MSLADCGVTIFADVCKKSNIELGGVQVEVSADKSPGSPVLTNMSMKVVASGKARVGS